MADPFSRSNRRPTKFINTHLCHDSDQKTLENGCHQPHDYPQPSSNHYPIGYKKNFGEWLPPASGSPTAIIQPLSKQDRAIRFRGGHDLSEETANSYDIAGSGFLFYCVRNPLFVYFRFCKNAGAIAQLVERLNGIQEVRSSTLLSSTKPASQFEVRAFIIDAFIYSRLSLLS